MRPVRPKWHCTECGVGWTGKPVCWVCGWTDTVLPGGMPYARQVTEEAERPIRPARGNWTRVG